MSRELSSPGVELSASLDLVRSLVHSWGDLDEGSREQARAILNSGQVLQSLLTSAHTLLGHICEECGNDLSVDGYRFCTGCLEGVP